MNEDAMSLKSSNSVRKKRPEENKFPFKIRFEKTLSLLRKINSNIQKHRVSFFSALCNKLNKLFMLIITLTTIALLYAFYTFWHLIPVIESSKAGFTLNVFTNWDDSDYRKGIILFSAFHLLFLMFLISLLRTFFAAAGYYDKEYINLYSMVKFIKHLFTYFIKWREADFNFEEMIKGDTATDDLEDILTRIAPLLKDRMAEFSTSLVYASCYNSIDVTMKKNIYAEIDEYNDNKEKQISQLFSENILESFENDMEHFITSHPFYNLLDKLQFHEKGRDNHRFCSFCLIKKPDRSHHCRQCKKCLRKMDHHCLFLYTCIAYNNYKFFLLTLFYGLLTLLTMCFTLINGLKFYINEYGDNLILTLYCVMYFFTLLLTLILTYFFYLHVLLITSNSTTIDYIEKSRIENMPHQIFSNGVYSNISSVLGNCLIWFVPIAHESKYLGYAFDVDREAHNQLLVKRMKEKVEIKSKNMYDKINNTRNKL